MSLEQLAEKTGKSLSSLQRWETGIYRLRVDDTRLLADALECEPEDIMRSDTAPVVPVVGRVGAGARVFPIDDHAHGDGLYEVRCPPGMDPKKTVAVEVVGDSMWPEIDEGWVLFYSRAEEATPAQILGKRCVVKVADDGPMLVKRVAKGSRAGFYRLQSTNAPDIEDVALDWASPVRAVMASEQAKAA